MIAEVFPEAYDTEGRPTFRPDQRKRSRFPSSFPIGRYISQPLSVECKNLEDLRNFFTKCRYVSDEEQFGLPDFWMPPEDFEHIRKGDCEDFALYAWRQLQSLGFRTRFVGGKNGRYGDGHAWVTFEQDGKTFLLEPQASSLGPRLPRLSTLGYKPDVSVEWDGEKAHFYLHKDRKFIPSAGQLPALVMEWIYFYARIIIRASYLIPLGLLKLGFRKLRGKPKGS
jgi:hypothetical protein